MDIKVISTNIEQLSKQRNLFLLLTIMLSLSCSGLTLKLLATKEKTILVPGLTQEVWTNGAIVSKSYLEEISLMYIPLLLDLNPEIISYKEAIIFKYISQSNPSYMKEIRKYFADSKKQYQKFGLSTYFSIKNLEVDSKNLTVQANGVLTSKHGERGIDSKEESYLMSFELVGGTPRLKEFVRVKSEQEIRKEEEAQRQEEIKLEGENKYEQD